MKVQANQVELKLNVTHQILAYVDDVNTMQYYKEKHITFISYW
jgi:hypothetical protein